MLLKILKSLEECSRFILALLHTAAERDAETAYLVMYKDLRGQLESEDFEGKKEYMKSASIPKSYQKGYYDNVIETLSKDMQALAKSLERYVVDVKSI